MQHLVDPRSIDLGPAAWFFLLATCLIVPAAAIRQHRRLAILPAEVTRVGIYVSGLATHAMLLVLVWSVIRLDGFSLFPPSRLTAWHLVVGAASLAAGLLPFLRGPVKDPVARERTRLIAPRSPGEFALFYLLSVSAGFVEEMAYRGVLFTLLAAITHSWIAAALLGAVFFGVAHLFQGRRSAAIAGLIGLRDHVVVGLTGTLWVVIIVHILHDAIAGTVLGLRNRRAEDVPLHAAGTPETTHAVP